MFKWNWLADVLRGAGLDVHEIPGWKITGHRDVGEALGVLCHHTACATKDDISDLDILEHGRPDLSGPLCNIALGKKGHVYIVSAGLAYHAGAGDGWYDIVNGNSNMIGIEAENAGDGIDPWPDVQLNAYYRICAALLDHMKRPTIMCLAHHEWTARKIDPVFGHPAMNMDEFRANVEKLRKLLIRDPPESENE